MGLNNHLIAGEEAPWPGLSVLESMMLVYRSRIDRLDVPARAIFSLPAVFKRQALSVGHEVLKVFDCCLRDAIHHRQRSRAALL